VVRLGPGPTQQTTALLDRDGEVGSPRATPCSASICGAGRDRSAAWIGRAHFVII